MIETILSGGQTGVDQAALKVATEYHFIIEGWCTKDGLDENAKSIVEKYPSLKQTTSNNPSIRTKLNIRDSDGTLIIVNSWPLLNNITDGTQLTYDTTVAMNKPCFLVTVDKVEIKELFNNFHAWIKLHHIKKLNIAGPRESSLPGIYAKSYQVLKNLLSYRI